MEVKPRKLGNDMVCDSGCWACIDSPSRPHCSQQPVLGEGYPDEYNRTDPKRSQCWPYYRTRVAELEAELAATDQPRAADAELCKECERAHGEQLATANARIKRVEVLADKRGYSGRRLDDDDVIQLGELRFALALSEDTSTNNTERK